MSREIKFRVWAYHHILEKYAMRSYEGIKDNCLRFITDNDSFPDRIVMQYTGLKDKCGAEIYEGDIVRWGLNFSGTGYDDENWHRYAVVELFPALQFKIIKYFNTDKNQFEKGDDHVFGFANFMYRDTDRYLEVIGNIHQNPELLP